VSASRRSSGSGSSAVSRWGAGADLDGAVAAGGSHELADRVLGHAERALDLVEPVVGADHELRARARSVGDVALPPGQRSDLGLQGAVHGLVGAGEGDEPVALDRHLPGHRLLGLSDLLVDPAQRAPTPIMLVLVVGPDVALRKWRTPARIMAVHEPVRETGQRRPIESPAQSLGPRRLPDCALSADLQVYS
jgi:hypothetical protein